MNNINLRAEVAVQITKEDLDVILFEALNAGGIAGWADRVMAVGNILASEFASRGPTAAKLPSEEPMERGMSWTRRS